MRAGLKARFDRFERFSLGPATGVQPVRLPVRVPLRQAGRIPQLAGLANLAFPGPRLVRGTVDAYGTMPV